MIGGVSLDAQQRDDADVGDAGTTVDDDLSMSSGCDAHGDRGVGSIEGGVDCPGLGDESCSEQEEGHVLETSVASLAPTTVGETSSPSYDGADACEEGGYYENGKIFSSRTDSIPAESIPVGLRDTSPSSLEAPPESEFGDVRGSQSPSVRETNSCTCQYDGHLHQSTSNEEPQAGLFSCLASAGEASSMDAMDHELTKAMNLLNRLAEDSKSQNAFEVALQSTQTRQEFGEEKESREDTDEGSTGIVATLEVLGDLCGRMDSLSDPCQEMLKREVPSAMIRLLRLMTKQYVEENLRVRHAKESQGLQPTQLKMQQQLIFLLSCYALASLSFRSDSDTKSAIGRLGGVDAILTVMRLQPDDELIQQFACGVLGNLLIDNETNAQRVHRVRGIGLIVLAMETHRSSAHLQEWALRTLNNLCHYESLRPHVVNAGGLSAIRDAVRIASEYPSTSDTVDTTFCRTWAIDALTQTVESLEQ